MTVAAPSAGTPSPWAYPTATREPMPECQADGFEALPGSEVLDLVKILPSW